jgi:hypothetical protein
MKVNITVVATKTFTAGLDPSTDVAMLQRNAFGRREINLLKIAQAWPVIRLQLPNPLRDNA